MNRYLPIIAVSLVASMMASPMDAFAIQPTPINRGLFADPSFGLGALTLPVITLPGDQATAARVTEFWTLGKANARVMRAQAPKELWLPILSNPTRLEISRLNITESAQRLYAASLQPLPLQPSIESASWALSAFHFLDVRQRKILLDRLRLLSPGDQHGMRRWLKDLAWLAGRRNVENNPGFFSNDILLQELSTRAGFSLKKSKTVLIQLRKYRELAWQRLARGEAILIYGWEVRIDPIAYHFIFSKIPSLHVFSSEPLVLIPPPKIRVNILIYNDWDYTVKLLDSMRTHFTPNIEIVLLNNGSDIDRLPELLERAKGLHYSITGLRLANNMGYDEAHNVMIDFALDDAHADLVLLLNSDLMLSRRFFEAISKSYNWEMRQTHRNQRLGIMGGMLLAPKKVGMLPIKESTGRHFSRFLRHYLRPKSVALHATISRTESSAIVDYVEGPILGLPSAMLREIGALDQRFFAYIEELDLGLRQYKAGYVSIMVPGASAQHRGQASSQGKRSGIPTKFLLRNTFLFAIKYRLFADPLSFVGVGLGVFYLSVAGFYRSVLSHDIRMAIAIIQGLWDGILRNFPDHQAGSVEISGYHTAVLPKVRRAHRYTSSLEFARVSA